MMIRIIKDAAPVLAVGIAVVMLLALRLFCKPAYDNAQANGNALGASTGEFVGTAIGSYRGVTQDYWEGWDAGKDQGLSADDTIVSDISYIQEAGNLQVFVAGVEIGNFHEVGDKYAAIYLLRGEVVFTVDLSQAQMDVDQKTIMIPQPEVTLKIDDAEVEKIKEWQAFFFNGSTEDGYTTYMNSIGQIEENAEESIANYDELLTQAQEAAKEQVQRLVASMTGEDVNVLFFSGR